MYIHMGWEGQKQFLQVLLFTYIIIIIVIIIIVIIIINN